MTVAMFSGTIRKNLLRKPIKKKLKSLEGESRCVFFCSISLVQVVPLQTYSHKVLLITLRYPNCYFDLNVPVKEHLNDKGVAVKNLQKRSSTVVYCYSDNIFYITLFTEKLFRK